MEVITFPLNRHCHLSYLQKLIYKIFWIFIFVKRFFFVNRWIDFPAPFNTLSLINPLVKLNALKCGNGLCEFNFTISPAMEVPTIFKAPIWAIYTIYFCSNKQPLMVFFPFFCPWPDGVEQFYSLWVWLNKEIS